MKQTHFFPALLMLTAMMLIGFASCEEATEKAVEENQEELTTPGVDLGETPKVSVHVAFDDSVFREGEDPGFTMTLVNGTDSTQRFVFDQLKSPAGGPWHTTADVKSLQPGGAALRYIQNIVMGSQAYKQEELTQYEYELVPGDSVSGHFTLSNIISLRTEDHRLAKGKYEIQFYFAGTKANVNVVRVE
jgi:hypothetical protein